MLAVLAVALLLFSCGKREKLIPRDTMSRIYADMFLADQWLRPKNDEFKRADTMRFYEPLFEKYGFTTEDFCYSVSHYLKDPRRFAKVLQKSSSILDKEYRRLQVIMRDRNAIESELRSLMASAAKVTVYYDTAFFAHAASHTPDMSCNERGVYVPNLTKCAPDSLPPADTLAAADSLMHLEVVEAPEEQEITPEKEPEIKETPEPRKGLKHEKGRKRRPIIIDAPDALPKTPPSEMEK